MYNNVNIHIPIPMLIFPWCFKCGTPGLAQGIQRGVTGMWGNRHAGFRRSPLGSLKGCFME